MSSDDIGSVLSNVSLAANRPRFELAFNMLQNTILKRLNTKIEDMTKESDVNNVDAFVRLKVKDLQAKLPVIQDYAQRVVRTRENIINSLNKLDKLDGFVTSGDSNAFNNLRDVVEKDIDRLDNPATPKLGMFNDDGILALQKAGTGIANFSDAATATTQVNTLRDTLLNKLDMFDSRQVQAASLFDDTTAQLSSMQLEIEATQMVEKAEALNEIKKLQAANAQFLQGLSMAFEVQLGQNEQMAKLLTLDATPPTGSVLNIFT